MERQKFTPKQGMTRRDFLGGAALAAGLLTASRHGIPAAEAQAGQRQKIEAAIPKKAFVAPGKKRKLLIFDLNVGYGGHGSIPTANLAFTLMGKKTGAFETVISKNPSV
ncbi:MAG: twin-arginine translocation signal domain-containing protein, partial [Planctomycetota bacterium]